MVIPEGEIPTSGQAPARVHEVSITTTGSLQPSLVNVIPGQVEAIHQGLLNVGIRMRVGERTDLRVRWPLGSNVTSELARGLSVKAVIPGEAVHLEAGYFRQGKRRWNRWIGRIVLVESWQERRVITVKLHHDPVTLKCYGSMTGSNWVPQVWNTVNVVVDSTKISLDVGLRHDAVPTDSRDGRKYDPFWDARVWLTAQVREMRDAPEGMFLSLLIGTTRVSVFICREDDSFGRWRAGMTLEIRVGRYDSWLKLCGRDSTPVLCGLLYLDSQSLAVSR